MIYQNKTQKNQIQTRFDLTYESVIFFEKKYKERDRLSSSRLCCHLVTCALKKTKQKNPLKLQLPGLQDTNLISELTSLYRL